MRRFTEERIDYPKKEKQPVSNTLVVPPLISVVIPVYHEEKILEDVLKIYTPDLRKKYHFELIVSDGGSTDTTLEIAEKYADKVVRHNESRRQTISEGRNKGAEAAIGSVIVFINGDTIPKDPDNFFRFIYSWSDNKNSLSACDALACKVFVNPDELIFKDRIFYAIHNRYVKFLNIIGAGMGRGECQIVRTEVFRRIGGYNSCLAAGEDYDLYKRIARHGKVRYTDKICVYESPRRFRKYGYIQIVYKWILNSLAVMFFHRSSSDEWEAVR